MIATARRSAFAFAALGLLISSTAPSFAGNFRQNHPRRYQVLHRDKVLGNRINNDYGHLGGHYGQLASQDQQIRQQEQRDAARNGGYISRGQQAQLNREENSLSRETFFDNKNNQFVQNHPRRAEVLSRDANLNYAINRDQGHLGGNYRALEQQDRTIARQEQQDARANGGYITGAEQAQLNQEESALRNQIRQDNTH